VYRVDDISAAISSGSFPVDAMIIAPCSMRTMASIAIGLDDNLLTRAASVSLKERRRLVLCPRETPLHLGHLRSMVAVTEAGAVVAPLMPAFYTRPASVSDIVDHTVGRLLDLVGVDPQTELVKRWHGPTGGPRSAVDEPA
jgi:4-hydroxy-3-polyprenylbenzoate decarboxylase